MAQTLKFGNKVWAAKEESVLAYNDINNNYKPLPFFFKRTSTGTRVNKDGLIETMGQDIARIDYTDSADGVLLLEPVRINNIFQSNQFNTTWTLTNSSVVGNQSGIYNTTDAWKLVGNGSNNDRINSNSLSSGAYTVSIYAKAGNSKFVALVLGSGVVYYNLEIGSVGSQTSVTNASIKSVGNEWYRLSMSVASGSGSVQVYVANGVSNVTTNNGDFIYIQHAQAEVGTFATSIIPTNGTAVTRAAETCNNSGNSEVFNDSEGVLFFDGSVFTTNESLCISVNDGGVTGSGNRVELLWFSDGNFYTQVGNSGQEHISSNTFNNKILIKYGSGSYDLYVNGFRRITDTFTSLTGLVSLDFKRQGSFTFKGKTKELGYYNTALTDAELETLTSYRNWVSMVNELNLNIIYNG